jgi:hypothetical protein
MRQRRSLRGPFEEQFFFEPDEIDEMCQEALKKSGYLPSSPQPIKIERFIEKHFQCLVGYDELPTGILGCTQFNSNGSIKAVIVSAGIDDGSDAGRRRERSTWSHEGGHCLMHPPLFMSKHSQGTLSFSDPHPETRIFRGDRILCRERNYDGRWWEWQANRAIGGFLLPVDLIRTAIKQFLQESPVTKRPSLPNAIRQAAEKSLANIFDVNPVVARIRLNEIFPTRDTSQVEF